MMSVNACERESHGDCGNRAFLCKKGKQASVGEGNKSRNEALRIDERGQLFPHHTLHLSTSYMTEKRSMSKLVVKRASNSTRALLMA